MGHNGSKGQSPRGQERPRQGPPRPHPPTGEGALAMAVGQGLQSTHCENVPGGTEAWCHQNEDCHGGHRGGVLRDTRRGGAYEDVP